MSIFAQSFEDQVAIVTGGSRGIGKAIASLLAMGGADVVIVGRGIEQAQVTADEIAAASGQKIIAYALDVADFDLAQQMAQQIKADFGRIDILVNNAGITRDNIIMRLDESDWDDVLDINLKGTFNCSKAVIRTMMKQRYGRIINITSVSGQAGQVGKTNYSAAKAGMIGLTKALAREVASRNITVNAVAPGFIPTTLTEDLPAELVEQILSVTPMGRMGTPEEVAFAAVFLASQQASYITGQVIGVDGGMVMM